VYYTKLPKLCWSARCVPSTKGAEQRRPKMESRELSARMPPRARPPARAAHYSVCLDRLPLFLIRRVHYQADVAHLNGQVRTAVKRRVGCRDLDGRSLWPLPWIDHAWGVDDNYPSSFLGDEAEICGSSNPAATIATYSIYLAAALAKVRKVNPSYSLRWTSFLGAAE
jgi:hypothetical protein